LDLSEYDSDYNFEQMTASTLRCWICLKKAIATKKLLSLLITDQRELFYLDMMADGYKNSVIHGG
jgi:hypothetical protein